MFLVVVLQPHYDGLRWEVQLHRGSFRKETWKLWITNEKARRGGGPFQSWIVRVTGSGAITYSVQRVVALSSTPVPVVPLVRTTGWPAARRATEAVVANARTILFRHARCHELAEKFSNELGQRFTIKHYRPLPRFLPQRRMLLGLAPRGIKSHRSGCCLGKADSPIAVSPSEWWYRASSPTRRFLASTTF